jgi:hypothetical protein
MCRKTESKRSESSLGEDREYCPAFYRADLTKLVQHLFLESCYDHLPYPSMLAVTEGSSMKSFQVITSLALSI